MRKLLALLCLLAAPAVAQLTSSDFTYQGAMQIPCETQEGYSTCAYGQRGMFFDPTGDSGNGSLWVKVHDSNSAYFEMDIPAAVDSTTYGDLNEPTILTATDFFDMGMCDNTPSPKLTGFMITSSYVWASCGRWYNVNHSSFDDLFRFNDTTPSGGVAYHFGGDLHNNLWGAWLLEIPSAWATTNFGGKTLATGHARNSHGGTLGPTFYVIDESTPEGSESRILYYGTTDGSQEGGTSCNDGNCDFPGYATCDRWWDAEWIDTATDDAMILVGRNYTGPTEYVGGGWDCGTGYGQILIYDVDDLANSYAGTVDPWHVLPYEFWAPSDLWSATAELGGAAFDAANGTLWVVERGAAGNGVAIIHEWSVGTPTGSDYVLSVSKTGDGAGTITSSPAGIDCGSDCQELYASSTVVTLTATPAGSSTFDGWSGDADCSDGSVTMSAARSCIATFSEPSADAPVCSGLDIPPYAQTLDLTTSDSIVTAIEGAAAGTWIRLAPGTYDISGGDRINLNTQNITITGQTTNAEDVILDAGYGTDECFYIKASDITLGHFTIKECSEHAISIAATSGSMIERTHIYDLVIQDNSAQQVKARGADPGWADDAIIECSTFLFTDTGRANVSGGAACYTGAIDAHGADDWIIRDNKIEGFWCSTGLPDPAIHLWNGSRDTIVERNFLMDNARGIMFGGPAASSPVRTYGDDPYSGDTIYHYDGVIRNNFVGWSDSGLSSSDEGMDSGIQCQSCKQADIYNNTVAGTFAAGLSAIEIRYSDSGADLINNLTTEGTSTDWVERDSATWTTETTNVSNIAHGTYFTDSATGDLHLTASATSALDAGTTGYVTDDYDGHPRANPPDVGADEYNSSAATYGLTISKSGTGTVTSDDGNIDCGSTCNYTYAQDDVVQLTALPGADYLFRFWTGDADCIDGEVEIAGAVNCTAVFVGKNFLGTSGAGVDID